MSIFEQLKCGRYNNEPNYKVVSLSNKKLCYIFCSSNGIYNNVNDDNAIESFNKDYYEWENISKHKRLLKTVGKYIFIRDPNAKFYIEGINKSASSIDKIIELLKKETSGYEVVLVGFSSGEGYRLFLLMH